MKTENKNKYGISNYSYIYSKLRAILTKKKNLLP